MREPPSERRRARGFSLLEVILAGVIFLVAVTAMTSTLTAASSTGARAVHKDAARDIARLRIEELLAVPSTSPLVLPGPHTEKRNKDGALDVAGFFTVDWTVTPHPQVSIAKLELFVRWTESGQPQQVRLESMR